MRFEPAELDAGGAGAARLGGARLRRHRPTRCARALAAVPRRGRSRRGAPPARALRRRARARPAARRRPRRRARQPAGAPVRVPALARPGGRGPARALRRRTCERALAHYGVEGLERTEALEDAGYRLFLARQRAGTTRESPCAAILAAPLERGEPLDDAYRAVLDRLETALAPREPALAELAREVRWRCCDAPALAAAREATYDGDGRPPGRARRGRRRGRARGAHRRARRLPAAARAAARPRARATPARSWRR